MSELRTVVTVLCTFCEPTRTLDRLFTEDSTIFRSISIIFGMDVPDTRTNTLWTSTFRIESDMVFEFNTERGGGELSPITNNMFSILNISFPADRPEV